MDRLLVEKFNNLLMNFKRETKRRVVLDIPHGEFFALHLIELCGKESGRVITADLSEKLYISKPAVSQMLNVLEEKGYAQRTIHKEDRRLTEITLTVKGQEILSNGKDKFLENISNILDVMGREDSEKLIDLLNKYFETANSIMQNAEFMK